MKTIHKYTLEGVVTTITTHLGVKFLCAQNQNDKVCVWALVDPSALRITKRLHIVGTGFDYPDTGLEYIGTVQQYQYVWHIFVEVPA